MSSGPISKMHVQHTSPVTYSLPMGELEVPINPLLGQRIKLSFEGQISCVECGRKIKETFGQGYCYPCFTRLAAADTCIIKPELCHYAAGTCREPEWGLANCMIPTSVYLANSSTLKVGITRGLDPRTRWIDQGASQGLLIRVAKDRLESGQIEVALKEFLADKTNWRTMLKGIPDPMDLAAERDRVLALYAERHPEQPLPGSDPGQAEQLQIEYPVLEYPDKIRSHNLEKEPVLEGSLMGIKGQYLILDTAVINMRKYSGFHLSLQGA